MTWSEKRLWPELRKLNANFRRQAPIGPYFADFAAHGWKLVIEVDGGVHERLDDVALRDGERQLWLQSRGYHVVRFTDRQVEDDAEACAEQVKTLLVAKGWAPPEDTFDLMRTPPSPALPPSRGAGG
ncbi:MAG: DUF559 domain-containing protein [Phenylobacterium sp.]|nr:DUF559 domain-containing protein [Phenylobacterium sp.]MCW5758234.1 DUF559 domain-containing protein [Phenylobacterium sp.]